MSKKDNRKKECSKCGKSKFITRDYYMSNSPNHADNRINTCKSCILNYLDIKNTEDLLSDEFMERLHNVLLDMNRPYIHDAWVKSIEESKERDYEPFGVYIKNINFNHRGKDWRDSVYAKDEEETKKGNKSSVNVVSLEDKIEQQDNTEFSKQNKRDVIRLLGYDPFYTENEEDKPNLYNRLVDYLDESTLEDEFKLSSVIEIVRTFNQIDKINHSISKLISSNRMDSSGAGGIQTLIRTKEILYKSVLNLAKENEISIKNASDKSQGSGTFSGMLKKLLDTGITEAEVNLFDIETSEGFKQIADISHQSIMNQLALDENDYNEMLREQRELIRTLDAKNKELQEENRLIKLEMKSLEDKVRELNNLVHRYETSGS